jgi:hypothetical protein
LFIGIGRGIFSLSRENAERARHHTGEKNV